MKLSIVIPAYNEARTIARMLDLVRSVELIEGVTKQVIVVNDCSKDGTLEALHSYQALHPEFPLDIESHTINRGKGAALHTGIARANGDVTVIQDADMEYALHGRAAASDFVFLAFHRQWHPDFYQQRIYQSQFVGYGNLLQNVSYADAASITATGMSLWVRARSDGQNFAGHGCANF